MIKYYNSFRILSENEAKKLVRGYGQEKYFDIVSITNPSEPVDFGNHAKSICRVEFDDEEVESNQYKLCSKDDIAKILKYSESVVGGNLIIHCYAGVCRSSACAFLVLLNQTIKNPNIKYPIDIALESLIEIKSIHTIHPNRYIINLGLDMLARNIDERIKWGRELYQHEIWQHLYNT